MVGRYHSGNERLQKRTHERTDRRSNQTRKCWVQTERNQIRIFLNRNRMDRSSNRPGRDPTITRQVISDKRIKTTK